MYHGHTVVDMISLLSAVGSLLSFRLRSRASLELELVALRHLSLLNTMSGICGAAPLASAFSDDSSQGTVQSYVRPVLRGLGPLASMRSAMRVAHQYFAL